MGSYAENTTVPVEKSRAEIEKLLHRYGATAFACGWNLDHAVIEFKARERRIRFQLPLPCKEEKRFVRDGRGNIRKPDKRYAAWEQACRQRWRALALCIKAKLEAVEAGISEFEDEFMAHIVLPGNETVSQWLRPQIEAAYTTGRVPEMMLALPAPAKGAK